MTGLVESQYPGFIKGMLDSININSSPPALRQELLVTIPQLLSNGQIDQGEATILRNAINRRVNLLTTGQGSGRSNTAEFAALINKIPTISDQDAYTLYQNLSKLAAKGYSAQQISNIRTALLQSHPIIISWRSSGAAPSPTTTTPNIPPGTVGGGGTVDVDPTSGQPASNVNGFTWAAAILGIFGALALGFGGKRK